VRTFALEGVAGTARDSRMSRCLICGRRGAAVIAWTTSPTRITLCSIDRQRWQSKGIPIRPDRPGTRAAASSSGDARPWTAAANAVRASRAA